MRADARVFDGGGGGWDVKHVYCCPSAVVVAASPAHRSRGHVADFQSLQQIRALQQHALRRRVDVVVLLGQVHQRRYGRAARVQQARAL